MTPERALYDTADTPEQAAELLAARGMPQLAQYICRLVLPNLPPRIRSVECLEKAILCETGSVPRFSAFHERSPADVAKALRWVATVCERGMGKALLAWEVRAKQIDQEAAVMLASKHESNANTSRQTKRKNACKHDAKHGWKGKGRKAHWRRAK